MNETQAQMLVETNTMVKMIYDQLPKLASCESVDAVRDNADHAYSKAASVHEEVVEHVKYHGSMSVNRNLIFGSYLGVIVAGIIAVFKK